MEIVLGIVILVMLICGYIFLAVLLNLPPFRKRELVKRSLMASHQENLVGDYQVDEMAEISKKREAESNKEKDLLRKFRYAQWKISKTQFYLYQLMISFGIAFVFFITGCKLILMGLGLIMGPVVMNSLLSKAINTRTIKFEEDFPPFIQNLVSMMKTGMSLIPALGAASEGMPSTSLVKFEVDFMLERMRYGVPEDLSIGAFGENINNPEIELFVQTLLLGKNVGGTLSVTLDRLAKQARRRTYFKNKAKSELGLPRGQIWLIILLMIAVMSFMMFMNPQFVLGAIRDPFFWYVWEAAFGLIAFGVFLIYKMTNVKI